MKTQLLNKQMYTVNDVVNNVDNIEISVLKEGLTVDEIITVFNQKELLGTIKFLTDEEVEFGAASGFVILTPIFTDPATGLKTFKLVKEADTTDRRISQTESELLTTKLELKNTTELLSTVQADLDYVLIMMEG